MTTELERIVMCDIHDDDLLTMEAHVPLAVQVRQRLNKEGFKFAGDGKFSSITNENPEPLGRLVMWYDIDKRTTYFKQWLST